VALHHLLDEPPPVILVRDVARHGVRTGDLLPQRGQTIRPSRGHDRHGPGAGERARQLLPEAGAGPGHDHHVAVEFLRHLLSQLEVTSVYGEHGWRATFVAVAGQRRGVSNVVRPPPPLILLQ
jgi:hypothetical protein